MTTPPRFRPHAAAALGLAALLAFSAGCNQFNARVEFRNGNDAYNDSKYREAIEFYERGLQLDPSATEVWRSLGLAAMALFRPTDTHAENMQWAETAIHAFEQYLDQKPNDAKVQEYLLSILLGANFHDRAIAMLEERLQAEPDNADVLSQIVNVLLGAQRFDEARDRLDAAGDLATATGYYSHGVASWQTAYNDPLLMPEQRAEVVRTGMDSLEKALELDPEYAEALVYMNLLAREQALIETDPEIQQEWIAKADAWREQAQEILAERQAEAEAAAAAASEAGDDAGTEDGAAESDSAGGAEDGS